VVGATWLGVCDAAPDWRGGLGAAGAPVLLSLTTMVSPFKIPTLDKVASSGLSGSCRAPAIRAQLFGEDRMREHLQRLGGEPEQQLLLLHRRPTKFGQPQLKGV
jgi:hypothetical protein